MCFCMKNVGLYAIFVFFSSVNVTFSFEKSKKRRVIPIMKKGCPLD